MNGIVINIDPVAFYIGNIGIRWYSIIVMLAVVGAMLVITWESRRKNIPLEVIYNLSPWVLVGGFLGARLFHVIDHWSFYASNPLQIFSFWQGGLAIWGAMAGGGIAIMIFAHTQSVKLWRLMDTLVPGLIVAQIIGRFACIINGDAYGGVTGLPWGFIYVNPGALIPASLQGIPTHPYPVYEIIWSLVTLVIVLKIRGKIKIDGLLFLGYLSVYSIGRFVLTFFRQENVWFWGLQEAQIVALLIVLVSISIGTYLIFKNRNGGIGYQPHPLVDSPK